MRNRTRAPRWRLTSAPCLWLLVLGACQSSPASPALPEASVASSGARPLFIATWPFGKQATERALECIEAGGSTLDAIEQGIRLIEGLSSDGSVGLGGRPNAAGYPQLDACIMTGPGHAVGSVAGLEGIVHPISAARRVMERTKHVMLVGEGARWFALEQGLETIDVSDLAAKKAAWVERERSAPSDTGGHDTVTLLGLDANGDLYGGCSTSGAGGKLPGRVGDSPICGAALYVDNEVGAAGATGVGENVMRYAATAMIVEFMRSGMSPQQACEAMLQRIARQDPLGYDLSICFIALDKQGRYGAAASNSRFPYGVSSPGYSEVEWVEPVKRP